MSRRIIPASAVTAALSIAAFAILTDRHDIGAPEAAAASSVEAAGRARQSPAYQRASLGGVPPKFDFVEHWSAPLYARGLAKGDFNGDGRDDLAAMGAPSDERRYASSVYLYLQTSEGTFAPPQVLRVPRTVMPMRVIGLGVGDFNEDDRDDLVITTQDVATGLLAMLSTPDGGFRWAEDHWSDGIPSYAVPQVTDQDGDGHLDVLLSVDDIDREERDPQPSQLATWFGDGHGGFPRHAAVQTGQRNPGLALAQLDGVGPLELVAVTNNGSTPPAVHRADGAGGWLAPTLLTPYPEDGFSYGDFGYFVFGNGMDVNGDGRDDLVLNLEESAPRLGIHLQQQDGTLAAERLRLASGDRSFLDRPVDLDGNGRMDLVQVGFGTSPGSFAYLLQDQYGLDYPLYQVDGQPIQGQTPLAIAIGDFTGDGIADVAISEEDHGIRLWRGRLTPYSGAGALPGAPSIVMSEANPDPWKAEATVTLAAPADSGGLPVTGYTVYADPGGGIDADAGSPGLVHRMTGLSTGSDYRFRVRASNAAGKGPASAWSPTLSMPAPPLVLSVYKDEAIEADTDDTTMSVRFWLNRPAPAGGVSFTVATQDGTANTGSDYDALPPTLLTIAQGERSAPSQAITIHGDFDVEGLETFQLLVTNVQGAGALAPLTIAINEDDVEGWNLALTSLQVPEGDNGTVRHEMALTLSKPAPADMDVELWLYSPDGIDPAEEGVDFAPLPAHIVIPAGQTTASIPVDLIGDTVRENTEAVTVVASLMGTGAAVPPSAVGLIEITDDDPSPTLSLSPLSVQEGDDDVVVANFRAALSGTQPDDAWFSFETVAGSATPGADYLDTHRGGLVIRAGQTTLDIPVLVLGDRLAEGTEQFGGRLVGPFQVALGDATAIASLMDNDIATGISVTGVSQPEGDGMGTARFVVELAAPQPGPVTFDVRTSDGTAFAGQDYVSTDLQGLVIPAGQTRLAVDVPILGDTVAEGDETFGLEITQAAGATPVRARALARLFNDDLPILSIADASATEGTGSWWAGPTMHFTVSLSAPSTQPVTFWLTVGDHGTATPSADMQYYYPAVTLDPGRTRASVDLPIYPDGAAEPDETFDLIVSAAHGAIIGDGVGIGTIIDDDKAAIFPAVGKRAKARAFRLRTPTGSDQ